MKEAVERSEAVQVGQRIVVIGTSGSGKTTLAQKLSHCLDLPHVELDALHWEPDWQMAPIEQFRQRVRRAVADESWVVDGNYSKVRDVIWSRADMVVWLDYPLTVILRRLLGRSLRRVIWQEELWGGNREGWRQLLSRDSIILWALGTYHRRRREYPELFAKPEYAHLSVIHLASPNETDQWLEEIC
ncbi:MAG: adenylate kinase [Chloroflexota bacterium]|nr:adenylate kinase [Chloroflexota bacterium]